MSDPIEPNHPTTTDRCPPASTEPDALAVRVSPTWIGKATCRQHAGTNATEFFRTDCHHEYRAAKRELQDQLMVKLGDNVSIQLILETDSFCEFYVTDHDGTVLGSALIEELRGE
ncbi:hypothetical protein SEA_LINETTI_95 [Gordonia phage Linetti]|nr:hypothetical protein SEA_LINETTI_95 [Gordonia phage Linetti]